MNLTKRIISFILITITLLSLLNAPAFGASTGTEKEVSLRISFKNTDNPIIGAEFKIYHIASSDENGTLTANEEFKNFNVNKYGKDDSYWNLLASTLEGYVLNEGISPEDSGKTDENGNVFFPTNDTKLPTGLYLVLAHRYIKDGMAYDTTPFMVLLPTANRENNKWIYEIEVSPKFTVEEIPEAVTRKVIKIWDDEKATSLRPKEITVRLLKDGTEYDSAVLSEENGWSFSWKNLDGRSFWTLTEDTVEGYETTISRQGITFVVKNTAISEDTADDPAETTSPSASNVTHLPQTGLLWWPVALLLCLGLLFIVLGLIRRRGSR